MSTPGAPCAELANKPRASGVLAANAGSTEVVLNVVGLQPGTYWFSVFASNAEGSAFRRSDILSVPEPPPGACPNGCPGPTPEGPAKPAEPPPWLSRLFAEESARTLAEYEAKQRLAQEAAAREREAQEAARQASEAAWQAMQATPANAPSEQCVVPGLRGKTLGQARSALTKAHCRLGRVARPARRHIALAVVAQGRPRGKRLPAGTAVSLTLGGMPARRGA